MGKFYDEDIEKSPRIQKLIDHLYEKLPVIEADRAVLLTESYKETEGDVYKRQRQSRESDQHIQGGAISGRQQQGGKDQG